MKHEDVEIRFSHRRKIAQWSFALMSLLLVGLIIAGVSSDAISDRIQNIQWLVGTAAGLWSTLILGYYASASYEQGRMQQ